MSESAEIEIRFKSTHVFMNISENELALLETMLPELIREMIQDNQSEDD